MELVAAMTENNVIGQNADMPWHLPADLAHFKNLTSGHAIIMGRRTWESIGKALPNRFNIVVTRQPQYKAKGAVVVNSLDEGQQEAGSRRIFIIGGGEMYAESFARVSHLHLTRIHTMLDGDTFFPEIDEALWTCQERINRPSDDKNPYNLTFETWVKMG